MANRLTTMNISLPATLRAHVDECMEADGFANASEYMRHLIRQDQARRSERLRQLIEEGERSGPPIEMTPARRAAFKEKLLSRYSKRKRSA